MLGATYLINNYDIGLLSLALPQIQDSLSIPEEEIGTVTGLVRLGVLPALVLASVADRVGRRLMLLITIIGFTLCTVATAFSRTPEEFMFLQFAARMFMYSEEVLAIVVVAEELDARARGWGIGVLAAMGAMGHGVASIFYSMVEVLPYGWRSLYIVGVVPLLILAWLRRGLRETKRFEDQAAARAETASMLEYFRPFRSLVRMYPGRLALLCMSVVPFWFVGSAALQFQSKFLQEAHGYSPANVALLFVFGGAFAIVGTASAGALSDRFGRRIIMTLALIGNAVGTLFFYQVSGAYIPPAWCLMLFCYFGSDVLFSALGSELFPTSYRSTASGVRSIMGAVGGAAGLWFEGRLYLIVGSHGDAITWMLLVAVISPAIIFLFIPETATRELEDISPEIGDQST